MKRFAIATCNVEESSAWDDGARVSAGQ